MSASISHPPKVVVFDVGNVLVDWRPMRVYAQVLPDPAAREAFFARVPMGKMNEDGDRGALAPAVAALAEKHPEDAALIRLWWERWDEMFGPELTGTADLLHAVKAAGHQVAALSNFATDTWEKARQTYPVMRDFDVEIVSGREGVLKPEAGIYEIAETRLGLSGPDLFFADDKAENVEAARARGWQAHHFLGAEGFAEALRATGLPF